jgi:tRNA pseudouridine55 synthase
MDGLFLVNKPPRLTSHDVVQKVRKILRIQKVGHFGTLDPMATGLMIVAVGKATRFFPYYSKLDKVYQGQIRLGFATNTYDCSLQKNSRVNPCILWQEKTKK